MSGPVGVRLHRADGTVLECELADEGVDAGGTHHWCIANAVYRPGDRLTAEEIPGHTSIGFRASPNLAGATIDWTDERDGQRKRAEIKVNRGRHRKRRRR